MEKDRFIFVKEDIKNISLTTLEKGLVTEKRVWMRVDDNAWVDKESGSLFPSIEFTEDGLLSSNSLDFLENEFICILSTDFPTSGKIILGYTKEVRTEIGNKYQALFGNFDIIHFGEKNYTYRPITGYTYFLNTILAIFTVTTEELSNLQLGKTVIEIKGS